MLLREEERRRSLIYRAGLLADTSQYNGWRDVEAALVNAGRDDASRGLSTAHVRNNLNRRCARAKRNLASTKRTLASS